MASERPLSMTPAGAYDDGAPDLPTIEVPVVRRRKRRWLRRLLVAVVALLVLLVVAGAILYENPTLLTPAGGVLLGTQPGAVSWNGSDPLNILVMGIDQRTNEQTRSDTLIVLHIDPASHDVKMLSVPRDLWVTIPSASTTNGYGQYKINAAYALGAAQGPRWSQMTVESVLGVPINYYAVLRFTGFKSLVDAMGGVTVCVPQEINDPLYPADVGYGFHPIDIKAGCQQMDGTIALEFVRERHVYAQQDLGRIQSQQALLAGIEKQMLSPGTVLRLPAILAAMNNTAITDLPHSALPELGFLLGRAKGSHTQHYFLNADGGYVTQSTSADGQAILQGNWPRINALVGSVFADPRLRAENATVQVRDGQHTAGLAALYTTILHGAGFNTLAPHNADKSTYTRSVVIANADLPGADYTARKLAQVLEADLVSRHIGADHPQIVAILGSNTPQGS